MTQLVRPIKNRQEYEAAVARAAELIALEPPEESPEADELELLEMVIQKFDAERHCHWPLSPLEAIQFRMQQMNLTRKDLEPFLGSMSRVSEVLAGKRPLTVQMIRRLHEGLGIPAKSLIGSEPPSTADDDSLLRDTERFPLKEMQDRGLFGARNLNLATLRAESRELVSAWMRTVPRTVGSAPLLRAPLHQTGTRTMDPYALRVWQLLVIQEARAQNVRTAYKPAAIDAAWMREVAKLSTAYEGPKLAQEFLSHHGICLVVVEHFHRTYLDGAAMLDGDRPIVALTLRHDRADNFWFALLHELAHVAQHLSTNRLFLADNLDDGLRATQSEEREADAMAQQALIPQEMWDQSAVKSTHSIADALELANQAQVNPAIVAGRLRYVTGNWRLLSGLIQSAGSVRRHFQGQLS
jgi:HTH-type transcriptional regulator/antitoxin HigA